MAAIPEVGSRSPPVDGGRYRKIEIGNFPKRTRLSAHHENVDLFPRFRAGHNCSRPDGDGMGEEGSGASSGSVANPVRVGPACAHNRLVNAGALR